MRKRHLALSALTVLTVASIETARADTTIYQSIPDLTAQAQISWCSQCDSSGQNVGQYFSINSSAVANTLSFVLDNDSRYWPNPVTVAIFNDSGTSTIGSSIYQQTFSTFSSVTNNSYGTAVATVNLGSTYLAAGAYDLFLYNTGNLGVAGFTGFAGNQIFETVVPSVGPATGDSYGFIFGGYDSGVRLASVPGPIAGAGLPVLLGLFGVLAARRRKAA